jgi:hypothetical protein
MSLKISSNCGPNPVLGILMIKVYLHSTEPLAIDNLESDVISTVM